MKNKTISIIASAFVGLCLQATLTSGATMELSSNTVEISTFYNGTTVTVTGEIPADSEAVIRVSGEGEELHLKKKGKVGGLLWMNTGDLTLENAPKIYMNYTSDGLKDLNASGARSFSLATLKDRIVVLPESEDKDFIIGEFIKLKEYDGLYAVNPGTVTYSQATQGTKTFSATVDVPSAMRQGEYSIDLAVVQGDRMVTTLSKSLKLQQVGFPALMTKVAFGRPLLFGIMSVVIALGAGLFMGTVFKGKGGAH